MFHLIVILLNFINCVNLTNNYDSYIRSKVKYTNENLIFANNHDALFKVIDLLKNKKCGNDLIVLYEGVLNKEEWALRLFDSSVKFPNGLLYGQLYQMGNYDECISVEEPNKKFVGKYCLVDVTSETNLSTTFIKQRGKLNDTIEWAICLPSSCNVDDYEIILKILLNIFIPHIEVNVKVPKDKCSSNRDDGPPKKAFPHTRDIIYIFLVTNILLLVLVSSLYHVYFIYKNTNRREYKFDGKPSSSGRRRINIRQILLCFSILNSIGKILSVKCTDLNFICGIKFISMTFIIAGHTLIFTFSGPTTNANYIYEAVQKVQNGFFLNSILLVDTFLMISGYLVYKLLTQEFEQGRSVNLLYIYIGRYVRLTPSYLIIIGLYATILIRSGNGPLWYSRIGLEQERCIESWWLNILYVNNYFNTEHLCMFQSWYLAVDTQLFVIGSLYTLALWKDEFIGLLLIVPSTLAVIVFSFVSNYVNKYDPTLMIYAPEILDISGNYYFVNVYIKTHLRAVSYLIGVLFGYIVHKLQSKNEMINRKFLHITLLVSLIIGSICMFTISIFYSPNYIYDPLESAFYSSLHRVGWCLSIGCIIITCVYNPSGLIGKFLSLKIYIPLSRITYSAYLINGFIELTSIGVQRNPFYMSISTLAYKVISHTVLTYISAFILCILFESPIHNLQSLLLKKRG